MSTVASSPTATASPAQPGRPIRVGVVGAGHRGAAFVEALPQIPGAELAAICDIDPGRVDLYAKRFNLGNALRTSSLSEMLNGDRVDAVMIAVPDYSHAAVAIECFRAGKDVMLEKPLAPTSDECRQILRAQRASGRLLQVGFVLRCHNFYRRVKEIVDSGRLGQIMFVRAAEYLGIEHGTSFMTRWHRRKANAGTLLLSKCSHDLDMLNWVIGSLPTHVASFGGNNFYRPSKAPATHCSKCDRARDNARDARVGSCRYQMPMGWYHVAGEAPKPGVTDLCAFNDDKDVVDNQVVILQYANQVRATFELQMFHPRGSYRSLTIGGEKAYLSGNLWDSHIHVRYSDGDRIESFPTYADNASGHDGSDLAFTRAFVESLRSRRQSLADGEAGLACNVIADAVERARLNMHVVAIDPSEYTVA